MNEISSRDVAYVTVDLVILTIREATLQVLVVERDNEPFRGRWALPGGFMRTYEDAYTAAKRELAEETGISGDGLYLAQFNAYSSPDRDPRGRAVSIAHLAITPDLPVPVSGSDARSASWTPLDEIRGTLAFDHDVILDDAVERARTQLEYTTIAATFCAEEFTVGDLRNVYEIIWGMPVDPRNFSRKVAQTEDFIRTTNRKRAPKTGRPAALYTKGSAQLLNPPLLRKGA